MLSASVSLAGLVVAFPLGCGLALVFGVINNYLEQSKGDPVLLGLGVLLVCAAIVCNGLAAGRVNRSGNGGKNNKSVVLAALAGVLMSTFYRFMVKGMDIDNFEHPADGMLTPYSAIFVFSIGILLSNIVFNTFVMKRPFVGTPIGYGDYFRGSASIHLVGMLGGMIWCLGTAFSYIAAGKAGAAVSYALEQDAPMITAIWGVFIWKEFKGGDSKTNLLLGLMFALFIAGLAVIVAAGN